MNQPLPQLYLPEGAINRQDIQSFGTSAHSDVTRGQLDHRIVSIKHIRLRVDQIPFFGRSQLEHKVVNQWRRASHQNVLPFLGLWDYSPCPLPAIVTPHVKWNIIDYLGVVPNADKYVLVSYVARALEYMHKQSPPILHGNIKGSNILVDEAGRVYLSDIGVYEALSLPNQVDLEVRWKAPEKLLNNQPHSAACDVWSFAMTILEVFTRRQPFHEIAHEAVVIIVVAQGQRPARPPRALMPDDILWQLLGQCWEVSPCDRPQIAQVVLWLRLLKEQSRVPYDKSNQPNERSFGHIHSETWI
ncbi:kinase-like protein [Macrolepiota fuliginosa MF-IS2]|uniref:Kinase-like protein n=1 Tax=Macrolepiota fuliginosa MF-IS2 TaxID=1400762 RepID=A0A9P5XEP9_9AGAR|nr:kinase-like protein [Macrolepiota fuliginosa MF-IS2]